LKEPPVKNLKKTLTATCAFGIVAPHTVTTTNKNMRTKALFLTAAAAVAGILSASAQVYSVNVVGYVNKSYPIGYSMAATPLKGTNNLVGTVLPNAPVGTVVFKFSGGSFGLGNTYFGAAFWSDNNQALPPGQGFFIKSPSVWTNTYVGEVVTSSTNSLITGYNMVGSAFSAAGAIDTNLALVPVVGDVVFKFNDGVGYNLGNTYFGAGFWSTGNPQLGVAQGMFYKSVGPNNWVQNFTIQ